jgi:hypothetical protein
MTDADLSALILEAPLIPNGWIAALDACNSAFDADLSILTFRSPSQTDSGVTAASTGSNEAIREWGPTLSLIDKEFASGLSSEPLKAMFRTNLMSMSEN